jgi:hypothetical protein
MTSTIETQRDNASKALYRALGAPVVTGRKLRDLGTKIAGELAIEAEVWEAEGRKLTGQIQESKVVEQVQARVDVDQLQEQVEKLRDQLETVLANWRTGFKPNGVMQRKPAAVKPEATVEPAKAAAKPAAKKPAVRKTAARKPAAKRPAAKKTS